MLKRRQPIVPGQDLVRVMDDEISDLYRQLREFEDDIGDLYVNVTGDTMTGNLIMNGADILWAEAAVNKWRALNQDATVCAVAYTDLWTLRWEPLDRDVLMLTSAGYMHIRPDATGDKVNFYCGTARIAVESADAYGGGYDLVLYSPDSIVLDIGTADRLLVRDSGGNLFAVYGSSGNAQLKGTLAQSTTPP